MYPDQRQRHRLSLRPKQQGLGLVAAIFVITVMAMISVGISNLVLTSQQSYGFEVLSARAFLAAESGAQLAVHSAMPPVGTSSCPASAATPSLAGAPGLSGCTVETLCSRVDVASVAYFSITSTGRCGNAADTAIRRLQVRVKNPL